ncbi:MAG TPA: response regulator [Thermoanaerobaculia bacterium]|nr:response regulator [Thermoanaerobaculia bacterium]
MPASTEATGPRILIVDDQSSNVRLLEHTLRRAGYVGVMSTTDPCEVIALHLQHRYDLILLDLQMPEMDGFAVLAQLQKIRPSHPVAVLVISAGDGQMTTALESGGDSFLAKPFRIPDVVERVGQMLKRGGDAVTASRASDGDSALGVTPAGFATNRSSDPPEGT